MKLRILLMALAVLGVGPIGMADEPVLKPTETKQPVAKAEMPSPSLTADPGFERLVDLTVVGEAWAKQDASMMTDGGLLMAEGERILLREHKGLSSAKIMEMAAQLAAQQGDTKSLERLVQGAKRVNNDKLAAMIEQNMKLASTSRDLGPTFSDAEMKSPGYAAYKNYLIQISAARMGGNSETLKAMNKAIMGDTLLDLKLKKALSDQIGTTELAGSKADPDAALLNKLASASRDGAQWPSIDPQNGGYPPQNGGYPSQGGGTVVNPYVGSAVIVDPGVGIGGGGTTQFVPSIGMTVFMTGGGAVVQYGGRLGSILFETGDIITSIGGVYLSPGVDITGAINQGYISGNRTVYVRNRNNGQMLNLYY